MEQLLESTIREFMLKINEEYRRVGKELEKTVNDKDFNNDEVKLIMMWKTTLEKLSSQCSVTITNNILYRKLKASESK